MARRKTPKNADSSEPTRKEPVPVEAVPEPFDDVPTEPMVVPEASPAIAEAGPSEPTGSLEDDQAGTDPAMAAPTFEAEDVPLGPGRIESIVESLLFAADKPLGLSELKRLLGERDASKITAVVEKVMADRAGSGVEVVAVAGGWQLRTNPDNAPWVGKLLAARPVRLSRAMMETVAIVAYRQPVTRPEIDEIRGVDCGPVLKTLLDRGLIRIIGKKEEVGRPLLYGTTPEFLKTFSLNDLMSLPTLQQFHELAAEEMARVDAEAGTATAVDAAGEGQPAPMSPAAGETEEEDDALLSELEQASTAARAATRDAAESEPGAPTP